MGFLEYILADIGATLGDFTMIGPRFSWMFLASALVVALIYYRTDRSEKWSLKQAVRICFPARVFLHPSSLLDYRFAVANYFIQLLSFGVFLASGAGVASQMQRGLGDVFGLYAEGNAQAGVMIGVLVAVALVLALDFGLFFAH